MSSSDNSPRDEGNKIEPVDIEHSIVQVPAMSLLGTDEQLRVLNELANIMLSEGPVDYDTYYARLRGVPADTINRVLSTLYRPTLKTILGFLRNGGDNLTYPVTVVRGSKSRRDWSEYVLRRALLTGLSSDSKLPFEMLQEEFDRVSGSYRAAKQKDERENPMQVYYDIFAAAGNLKLYTGYVDVSLTRVGDLEFLKRDLKKYLRHINFEDDDVIANICDYRPHPFEQHIGFYDAVGISTSEVDGQILGQMADDLFSSSTAGLTLDARNPDFTSSYHSKYSEDRESNPAFEGFLGLEGFQGYGGSDFIKVSPKFS